MFGNDEITHGLIRTHQQQLRQEADAYRLTQQSKSNRQTIYGSFLANVGEWMSHAGESLQQRYSQSPELASDPSAECVSTC